MADQARTPYGAHQFGGVLAESHGGGVAVLASTPAGIPQGARLVSGGPDWVDEPARCTESRLDTGWPCEARPLKNDTVCKGHQRTRDKRLAAEKG